MSDSENYKTFKINRENLFLLLETKRNQRDRLCVSAWLVNVCTMCYKTENLTCFHSVRRRISVRVFYMDVIWYMWSKYNMVVHGPQWHLKNFAHIYI